MRPSPARAEAPEPDVWLPILHITGELEAIDLSGELELLDLEHGRADLDVELQALEADFWSSAPRELEAFVADIVDPPAPVAAPPATAEPAAAAPEPSTEAVAEPVGDRPAGSADPAEEAEEAPAEPISLFEEAPAGAPEDPGTPVPAPVVAAAASEPAPEREPDPAPEPQSRTHPGPSRAQRRHATHRREVRNRIAGTVIVVALLGALATVTPSVVGASVPQRHITVTLDGHTVQRTVRLGTVGDVLEHEGIVVHSGDRVVPAPGTELREDMHIEVLRAFPVNVEVDGAVRSVRTTAGSREALRRELGIDRGLLARGPADLASGATIAFRTPHAVSVDVDGRTIEAPRSGALDVAELLREQGVGVGPRDEVIPALATRLTTGLKVHVYRLADGQVAERVAVPFATEVREDPSLPRGQSRTIQAGVAGERRDVYKVTTRDDGTVVQKVLVGSEAISAPVGAIVARGTAVPAPSASGSATWYGTGPGPGTCAHLRLPFGTMVTLTNRDTGASAQCRVQDRGPETWTGHVIDLSPDVFRRLAPLSQGIIPNLALSY